VTGSGATAGERQGRWQADRRRTDQEKRRVRRGSAKKKQLRRAGGAEAEGDLLGVGADLLSVGRRQVAASGEAADQRCGLRWGFGSS